jgi:hypothetical protein
MLAMSYATISDVLCFSRDSSAWQSNSPTYATTSVRHNHICVCTPPVTGRSSLQLLVSQAAARTNTARALGYVWETQNICRILMQKPIRKKKKPLRKSRRILEDNTEQILRKGFIRPKPACTQLPCCQYLVKHGELARYTDRLRIGRPRNYISIPSKCKGFFHSPQRPNRPWGSWNWHGQEGWSYTATPHTSSWRGA